MYDLCSSLALDGFVLSSRKIFRHLEFCQFGYLRPSCRPGKNCELTLERKQIVKMRKETNTQPQPVRELRKEDVSFIYNSRLAS